MMLIAAASKTPFYIAGGIFVLWAAVVSVTGINRADFPPSAAAQRLIILVSALLATASIATAIATA